MDERVATVAQKGNKCSPSVNRTRDMNIQRSETGGHAKQSPADTLGTRYFQLINCTDIHHKTHLNAFPIARYVQLGRRRVVVTPRCAVLLTKRRRPVADLPNHLSLNAPITDPVTIQTFHSEQLHALYNFAHADNTSGRQ